MCKTQPPGNQRILKQDFRLYLPRKSAPNPIVLISNHQRWVLPRMYHPRRCKSNRCLFRMLQTAGARVILISQELVIEGNPPISFLSVLPLWSHVKATPIFVHSSSRLLPYIIAAPIYNTRCCQHWHLNVAGVVIIYTYTNHRRICNVSCPIATLSFVLSASAIVGSWSSSSVPSSIPRSLSPHPL